MELKTIKKINGVVFSKLGVLLFIIIAVTMLAVTHNKLSKTKDVKADNLEIKLKTDTETKPVVIPVEQNETKKEVTPVKNEVESKELTTEDIYFNNSFIDKVKSSVVAVSNDYGLYPSIMMAQAIIESGWGESKLAIEAQNYFGVKAREGQNYVTMKTEEDYGNGQRYVISANFAKYDSIYESMEQNALVLRNNPKLYWGTYRENAESFVNVAYTLQGTYATATNYAQVLIDTINNYKLYQLDYLK